MMRRNGIVRVPKLWHDAATEAFFALQEKGGGSIVIPLPLKVFPYPSIRAKLLAIYPDKFVPLYFAVKPISAGGSTGTKSKGGYPVDINLTEKGASAISTILHELRHVVQYLGDEVVKTKTGTFGRPSLAATASLRARKKAIKSGKIKASGFQAYLSGASEWQPWVGSTADKIVGSILYGKLTTTKQVNDAIRSGILNSTFYTNTDPATRKELMKQVYTEIMRQLRGYTDIVPAKHAKASVGLATLKPSAPKASASSASSAPKPAAASGTYVVTTKIVSALPSIASEATYAGKDTKGRDKLAIGFDTMTEAVTAAHGIAAQAMKGMTFHNGAVYVVRIYDKSAKKEHEVYDATADGPIPPGALLPEKVSPVVAAVFAKYPVIAGQPKTEWGKKKTWTGKVTSVIPKKIGVGKSAVPNPDLAILTAAGWAPYKLPKEPSAAGWEMKNPRRTRRAPRRRR
jgi:hypothetical protein